jgi:PAS domain S-box-containing protein
MQDPLEVDQKPFDDSELIALFDQTKKEIEAHGASDELDTSNHATNKKLLTRCLDAIDVMTFKMTKLRERLVIGLKPVKTNFRQARDGITRLGRNAADKRRKLQKELRGLPANSLSAVGGKVTKLRERLDSWLKPVKARFWRAQDGRTRLGRPADKSRKLRTRENDLRKLLANSPDAVVVTSTNRRFVAANPKGLGLFGISETNMTMFTLDVFLPCGQLPRFNENGAPLLNRKERHGECEIRRLDGSLRVAEFVFVPNYVPFLHVFRFQNDRKWTPRKRLAA